MDISDSLSKSVGFPMSDTIINISVHDYNAGVLVLARTLPPQVTSRSKYYATNTVLFHEDIVKCGINLLKIDTVEQIGGIFIKGLSRTTFEYLLKNIMSW